MLTGNTGRVVYSTNGSIGGSKFVFVQMTGKPEQQRVPIGMQVLNPFTNKAKMFEGDLVEYKIDGTGYLLKMFKLAKAITAEDTTIYFERGDYSHRPESGNVIMKAPATFATTGTAAAISAVTNTTYLGANVYSATIVANSLGTASAGDIFVEGAEAGSGKLMLVTNPNAFIAEDVVFDYGQATDDNDMNGARYFLTPILHETAWKDKMTACPAFLNAINKSLVTGWFQL